MNRLSLCYTIVVSVLLLGPARTGRAETSNGNDFALYLIEARTPEERKALVDDAKGRPHFFRYLQIMEIEERPAARGKAVAITAFEPSSYMDVKFVVTKRNSLKLLSDDPVSKVGDAIAVTGMVKDADSSCITLDPVVVRFKDRLHPKRGKELLCEVDPTATFYSYTGGKQPVSLTYKDRDLLLQKDKVLAASGKQGWADFLERELAKRNKARSAAAKSGKTKP